MDIRADLRRLDAKYDQRSKVMLWLAGLNVAGVVAILGIIAAAYLRT